MNLPGGARRASGARRGLSLLLGALLALGTGGLAGCGASVPPVIREELARTPRGMVTVVVFTDFQCPFCRRTHAALAAVVAARPGRVRVVHRHVPLRMHPDAETAARAAICAEPLPMYEAYVAALFASNDLSEEACEELAVSRGAARETFRACVSSPATEARIRRDTGMLDVLGGDGVPLLYVGGTRLDGAQTRRALERAIDEAGGADPGSVP